jgi:hypothetical protein
MVPLNQGMFTARKVAESTSKGERKTGTKAKALGAGWQANYSSCTTLPQGITKKEPIVP